MQRFVHFDLQMCFSLQRRAIFPHPNFKSGPNMQRFVYILTCKCASRYSGVRFSDLLSTGTSAPGARRFTEVTFRPSRPTNHCKTHYFATSLPFRACGSSYRSRMCIFFLTELFFQLSILSEIRFLNFLRIIKVKAILIVLLILNFLVILV